MKLRCALVLGLILPLLPPAGPGPTPVAAQLSSQLPGVPTAGIPTLSRSRGEGSFEANLTWDHPNEAVARFSEIRMTGGRSYRVTDAIEVGASITFLDVSFLIPREDDFGNRDGTSWDASTGYDLSIGAKYQLVSLVDPDGYGPQAAIFGSWRPSLEPAFRFRQFGDGEREYSGLLAGEEDGDEIYPSPPQVPGSHALGAVVSYGSPQFLADLAIQVESVRDHEVNWVQSYSGVHLQAGVLARLRPSLAIGLSYWGSGGPPWRNTPIRDGMEERSNSSIGLVLSSDDPREGGTRFMITSPTGALGESVRIQIYRYRSR
jgi:hypothetical protein